MFCALSWNTNMYFYSVLGAWCSQDDPGCKKPFLCGDHDEEPSAVCHHQHWHGDLETAGEDHAHHDIIS